MNLTDSQSKAIAEFPQVLQDLIYAELAAGNSIVEIGSGFPAPPVGACLKLAKNVSTRPRDSDDTIDFYERCGSSHNGEFTDEKRFFFVLEPPEEPEPYPDMDAIRAGIEARQRAADADRFATAEREARTPREVAQSFFDEMTSPRSIANASPIVKRFVDSMEMNYERWHDGIGYDLEAIEAASPKERSQIEEMMLTKRISDWRDVEALMALDTPRTRKRLKGEFANAELPQKIDLISHATSLFTKKQRTAVLISALEAGEQCPSLTQVMLEIEDFHPTPIVKALMKGVRSHDGATAGQYAMMLLFIHGKATSRYDMDQRPFILRFQSDDRDTMYRELCERLGVNA